MRTLELTPEGSSNATLRRPRVPGRGNSLCKGSEVGPGLTCSIRSRKAGVARAVRSEGNGGGLGPGGKLRPDPSRGAFRAVFGV